MNTGPAESSRLLKGQVPMKKNPTARCYYVFMFLVYLILFLVSVVSLGSFGVTEHQVRGFYAGYKQYNSCILYGAFKGYDVDDDGNRRVIVRLSNIGSCGFVLWGLISVMIVMFVWVVSSFLQIFIVPRVFSVLRLLDFVVLFFTFLLSFALSITITAGINTTCTAAKANLCQFSYLIRPDIDKKKLYYYNPVHSAQTSSWINSVALLFLLPWYFITCVVFFKQLSRRRREVAMTRFQNEDAYSDPQSSSDTSSTSDEELEDVNQPTKPSNPFTAT